jgi:hypothetical protein
VRRPRPPPPEGPPAGAATGCRRSLELGALVIHRGRVGGGTQLVGQVRQRGAGSGEALAGAAPDDRLVRQLAGHLGRQLLDRGGRGGPGCTGAARRGLRDLVVGGQPRPPGGGRLVVLVDALGAIGDAVEALESREGEVDRAPRAVDGLDDERVGRSPLEHLTSRPRGGSPR